MNLQSLTRKVILGLPYLGKEIRAIISDRTPCFIAVPRAIHIWTYAPCNGKCIMCDQANRTIVTSPFTNEMMHRALNEIHELCGRGTLVSYMGGEPTLNRNITEWIERAGELHLDFRFTTNGYLMTEDMARRFVAAGLFNIGVSLESLDHKINETMRPYPNGTAKTLRCIELLLSERERQKKPLSINIKTVLTEINMESFIEIAKQFGKLEGVLCTPQVFEPLEAIPSATKELLYIKDLNRLQRITGQIRDLKREGYNIHITEQGLREMVKSYRDDNDKTSTMHNKKLEMDPSEPRCSIGTDNLFINQGLVNLCPYHPPIYNFATDTKISLKKAWESEKTRLIRAQTRACRRLCVISCLRRSSLSHKAYTFLKIS